MTRRFLPVATPTHASLPAPPPDAPRPTPWDRIGRLTLVLFFGPGLAFLVAVLFAALTWEPARNLLIALALGGGYVVAMTVLAIQTPRSVGEQRGGQEVALLDGVRPALGSGLPDRVVADDVTE